MGIPVIRHDEKKPGGIDEVLAFFEGKDPEGGTVSASVASSGVVRRPGTRNGKGR